MYEHLKVLKLNETGTTTTLAGEQVEKESETELRSIHYPLFDLTRRHFLFSTEH